jgi:hypothetical protein
MMRIYQSRHGNRGNCFEACLASILEIPLDQVPDLSLYEDSWDLELDRWLKVRGWDTIIVTGPVVALVRAPAISVGPSPRGGCYHAVVTLNGKLTHDPHPEGGGLAGPIVYSVYLIPTNPAKLWDHNPR